MLRETRQHHFQYIVRQLPNPTAFLNTKLEVVYASDTWIEAFEFQDQEVLGKSILELAPDVPKRWMEVLGNCLNGVQGQRGTERFIGSDRQVFWFEYINNPWYDENENIIGILIQITDITKRIQGELEHEKTKLLLKEKSEIARIGSWEYDAVSDRLHWSDMTRRIHEVPKDFVPTLQNGIDFYKEGYSRNTISMAVYKAIETGEPWSEKLQIITAKGQELWVLAAGKPLYKNGEYIGLIGTFQDINEMMVSNLKIRESETLLRTVVDSLPLNVYIKDLESRKILVNRSEMNYLGVTSPEEVIGKKDADFMDSAAARKSVEEDQYVMRNGREYLNRETIAVKKDGTVTHFLTSKIPLRDAQDQIYGLLGISLDITELKQKEVELRELINVTSQQNKKLINFAHIVSHNLRSHASNFAMLLDLLPKDKEPKETRRIHQMLIAASDNLMETLENLNEVVSLNASLQKEKIGAIRLDQIFEKVRASLESQIQGSRAEIVDEIPDNTIVPGVAAYVESILTNLITNAIKYKHPDRAPLIRVRAKKDRDKIVLSVSDNGQGIDLERHGDKLFGMYKTFHDHPDARGIGLYITKNQVEAMHASIEASSQVGKGTIFNVYFNAKQ